MKSLAALIAAIMLGNPTPRRIRPVWSFAPGFMPGGYRNATRSRYNPVTEDRKQGGRQ